MPKLLIVSLGNPAPYALTRHSAGHIVLSALSLLSPPPSWTLAACPTQMNVSGPWVAKTLRRQPAGTGLVVLHDALDLPLGKVVVKPRAGGLSAKGHNGIRSVLDSLRSDRDLRGAEWTKVSIGIGRPESRDVDVVSRWVLGKFKPEELGVLRGRVAEECRRLLEGIEGDVS